MYLLALMYFSRRYAWLTFLIRKKIHKSINKSEPGIIKTTKQLQAESKSRDFLYQKCVNKVLNVILFSFIYLRAFFKMFQSSFSERRPVDRCFCIVSFIIVIRNGKIVGKHGPYCWYFRLNLKSLEWTYREYIKIHLSVRIFSLKMILKLF